MKVLIGSPISIRNDFALERWLRNAVKLTRVYPCDLLMVDTSEEPDYVETVKSYCKKIGLKDFKIEHLEISKFQPYSEKIGRSWEAIRQAVLKGNYDAWFSWGCDIIIPANTLTKLVKIMENGNYSMVHPNSSDKVISGEPLANFGCCLINRDVLEKYTFMLTPPENCWAGGETRFKKKVLAGGGNYLELYGTIKPIYHLNQNP